MYQVQGGTGSTYSLGSVVALGLEARRLWSRILMFMMTVGSLNPKP